jgi:hypothetical protein
MKKIADLTIEELDYLIMRLEGAEYMLFGNQIRSFVHEYGRSEHILDEMQQQGVEIMGQRPEPTKSALENERAAWQCRYVGFQMAGTTLLDATLRCFAASRLGSESVDETVFTELYEGWQI